MKKVFYIENEEKYTSIIRFIEETYPENRVFLLSGDLGAGKTTFIKLFLSLSLKYSGLVTSPTYQLIHEYELENNTAYHMDFYRITSEEEFEKIGVHQYLDSSAYCFIEWPQVFKQQLATYSPLMLDFTIEKKGRTVTLSEG